MKKQVLIAVGLLVCTIFPANAQSMSAAEVEAEIIGKTVCVATPNGEVCIRHNADNTSNVISGMPEMTGEWRMDGDQHCVTWPGADERCTAFARDGDGYVTDSGSITVSD